MQEDQRLTLQWCINLGATATYSTTVAFSPDSHLVIVGTAHAHRVIAFEVETGHVRFQLPEQGHAITVVRFTADGTTLLTGCEGGWVRAWSAQDGTLRQSFQFDGPIDHVLPWRGDTFLCQAGARTLAVLERHHGREVHRLMSSALLTAVAVAQAGGLVAFVAERGMVHLWEPVSGRLVPLGGGREQVRGTLTFDSTEAYLAEGYSGGIRLWSLSTGQRDHLGLPGGWLRGTVHTVAFQPNGRLIAAGMFRGELIPLLCGMSDSARPSKCLIRQTTSSMRWPLVLTADGWQRRPMIEASCSVYGVSPDPSVPATCRQEICALRSTGALSLVCWRYSVRITGRSCSTFPN